MFSRTIGSSPDAPQEVPLGDKGRLGGVALVFLQNKKDAAPRLNGVIEEACSSAAH